MDKFANARTMRICGLCDPSVTMTAEGDVIRTGEPVRSSCGGGVQSEMLISLQSSLVKWIGGDGSNSDWLDLLELAMTTEWKDWEHSLSTTSVAAPPFEAPSFDQATGRAQSYGKMPNGARRPRTASVSSAATLVRSGACISLTAPLSAAVSQRL